MFDHTWQRVAIPSASILAGQLLLCCAGDSGGRGVERADVGSVTTDVEGDPGEPDIGTDPVDAPLPTYVAAEHAGPAPPAGELGGPRVDLTADELQRFEAGRALFVYEFSYRTGLGPYWEETSCAACHFAPVLGGAGGGRLLTFGPGEGNDVEHYPLHAAPGFDPLIVPLDASLVRPRPLFGLGLLESVPDELIIAGCDPNDDDGDGVRGRAAMGRVGPTLELFRLGSKANQPSVRSFTGNALISDMGITSVDGDAADAFGSADDDSVADPEVEADVIDLLEAFVVGLAPPPPSGSEPHGEAVFVEVGCAACHRRDPGPQAPGAYTDLCLHDMGDDLANGIRDADAGPRDFRTPPLWGLRHQVLLLHDGSARTPEQAIVRHDGEARSSRQAYEALDSADRDALLAFLDTL
ncbi:MAG: c-type cytochrome [Myxococcales bacterium]|nr:c-type cytochrome [Myxococcales bacterium]